MTPKLLNMAIRKSFLKPLAIALYLPRF